MLALFVVRLELDTPCMVNALMLVEKCVRAGLRLRLDTVRPVLLTALVLASKESYDEVMTVGDFRRVARTAARPLPRERATTPLSAERRAPSPVPGRACLRRFRPGGAADVAGRAAEHGS